jgi:hypothetical protein
VRNNIREGHPDYTVTGDSWPSFLYPRAKGDVNDMERGLFRSAILLKVYINFYHETACLLTFPLQAYKFIFTSPSSAQDIECQEDVDEHAPSTRNCSRRHQKGPTRGHVANLLGLKSVTPRSLAYVAVQVSLV